MSCSTTLVEWLIFRGFFISELELGVVDAPSTEEVNEQPLAGGSFASLTSNEENSKCQDMNLRDLDIC